MVLLLGILLLLPGCRGQPPPPETVAPTPGPSPSLTPQPQSTALPTQPQAVLGLGEPRALAWSPDGAMLAVGSAAGVYLYSGEALHNTRQLSSEEITALAWSPDGQQLAWGTPLGEVALWEVARQRVHNRLSGEQAAVTALGFSPDSHRLAIGYADGRLALWQMDANRVQGPLLAHTDRLTALTYCGQLPESDSPALFSAGRDGSLVLWEGRSADLRATLRLPGTALLALACSPATGRVYSASAEGVIQVWGPQGQILRYGALPSASGALTVASPGYLAAGDAHGLLWLWDAAAAAPARRIQAHAGKVLAAAYRPGSDTLASLGSDGALHLWNGNPQGYRDTESPPAQQTWRGFAGRVQAAALWHGRLLSAHADGALRLWEVQPAGLVATLSGHRGPVNALVVSEEVAISGGMDGTLRMWSPQGVALGTLYAHRSWVSALTLAGQYLVSAAGDGALRLWREGQPQAEASLPEGLWAQALLFRAPATLLVLRSDGRIGAYSLPDLRPQSEQGDWPPDIAALAGLEESLLLLDSQGQVWMGRPGRWQRVDLPAAVTRIAGGGGNTWFAADVRGQIWRGEAEAVQPLLQTADEVTWLNGTQERVFLGLRNGEITIWALER